VTYGDVIDRLKSMGSEHNRQGMGRYGINVDRALGISIYELRNVAKEIGTDHQLALELWDSDIHEARILASFIADPDALSETEMERWVSDFDSWDMCDQVCDLFQRTPFARRKVLEWAQRQEEFVRRAGFVLIAHFAVYDKQAPDDFFTDYFPLIREGARDDRNFVNKAVNWSLRNIGKRNLELNQRAIELAAELKESSDRAVRRVGSAAWRELTSDRVQARLRR
jgi:3-methyladenine DNA glycosylase AlkD